MGLNIYTGPVARADGNGYRVVPYPVGHPKGSLDWFDVNPDSMYYTLKITNDLYKPKKIYITENTICFQDAVTHGRVNDEQRVRYLKDYIAAMHRALAEGVPVKGYFHWSLFDNFEWASGYVIRCGAVYYDYATHRSYPKDSALMLADLYRTGQLTLGEDA